MRPTVTLLFSIALIAAFGAVAFLQTSRSPVPFDPTFYHLAVLVGVAAILAVSLNMVNGFTGQFSLGHAGFLGIGMYSALYLNDKIGPKLFAAIPGPTGVKQTGVLLVLLVVGGALAALGGLVVGLPSLRLRGDYLAIVTLGFGEILRVTIQNVQPLGASLGYQMVHTETAPPQDVMFFWVGLFAVLTVMVARNLMLSGPGRAFLAVREDEIAAEAVGVNTYSVKVRAFVLSAMFAGFAGVLNGLYAQYASPTLPSIGFLRSIEIVVMVVLGGLGSISGAVLAAAILTALPETLRQFDQYRMVAYSLMLILLMLLRPQGIFGTRELSWSGFSRRRVRSADPREKGGGHEPEGGAITG